MKNSASIIIPIFNEEENILILLKEIQLTCNFFNYYEIIIVDDKSNDDSVIKILQKKINNLNLLKNNKNMGQSYCLYKGVKEAKFETIVTLDGDLQNDPKDIKTLFDEYLKNNNTKLVSGIRKKRKDSIIKIISSKIANNVRSYILKDGCEDTGCSLKVFDKKTFLNIPFFNGIHRFIPAFFVAMKKKVVYVNVNHRPRRFGNSNYSTVDRLFIGIADIYRVKKMIKKLN
tara:strand:- start:37 stop:726 length:690 start_codon:yes stop_codon:yes gene_type:complete